MTTRIRAIVAVAGLVAGYLGALIASLTLVIPAVASVKHTPFLASGFGPVKATVASSLQAGVPTVILTLQQYALSDTAFNNQSCLLLLNSYSSSVGAPYVEVPTGVSARGFGFATANEGAYIASCGYYGPGQCVQVSGHVLSAPDLAGQTWIADAIAPATCP